jgi:uncharacterized delta-60 repeat protein
MKNYIIYLFLWFFSSVMCQNYFLDASFGNNGTLIDSSINNYTLNVYYQNEKYYLVHSTNSISCLNDNGSKNINFGSNGIKNFNITNQEYIVEGSKLHSDYIYIYGYINTSSDDVFIAKMSLNGELDSNFGTNGIVIQDFGSSNAVLNDILFLNDKIMGIGTKSDAGSQLFLTKYNLNGTLDLSFDQNGYKLLSINQSNDSFGVNIYLYENNLLLVGKSNFFNSSNSLTQHELLLLYVNENGEYIPDFGTNGVKKTPIANTTTGSYSVLDSTLKDDKLFFSTYLSFSFNTQFKYLNSYNIISDSLNNQFLNLPFQFPFYQIDNHQKIYFTGTERCSPPTATNCKRDFKLYRTNLDGTVDSSFNSNGVFTHNFFPNDFISDDQSTAFYLHSDGKVFMAGIGYNPFSTNGSGLALLRITNSPLSIKDLSLIEFDIYPNPVSDFLFININENIEIDNIIVYDHLGKRIINSEKRINQLDVSSLSNGVYIIKVFSEGVGYSKKFIKI